MEELTEREKWEDDIMRGIDYSHKLLEVIKSERSQLYGMLIHLMLQCNLEEVDLPPIDVFRGYGNSYYIIFSNDSGKFTMKLLERPSEEVEKDGSKD